MAWLFALLWVAGGVPAAVLGEVMRADSPRTLRAARIAFALLLGADLLLAAAVFSFGTANVSAPMTRGIWWLTVLAGGVPLALVSGFAVRRGYVGHRLALITATLLTAALYFAFPLGFVPATDSLHGFGRLLHDNRALGIGVLLIPTLILLAAELLRKAEGVEPIAESDRPSLRSHIATTPRRNLIGAGVVLLALIWISGTNTWGFVVGLGIVLGGFGLYVWHRNRVEVQSALRNLEPREKS